MNSLYDFLDQDNDGYISLPEIYYLQDITKTAVPKVHEEHVTLPLRLQGLEEGSLKVRFILLISKSYFPLGTSKIKFLCKEDQT